MSEYHDKCGLYGIVSLEPILKQITSQTLDFISHDELKSNLNEAFIKLQHRGQESYGISYLSLKTNRIKTEKFTGLISSNFITNIIDNFEYAICHNRYSTSKNSKTTEEYIKLLETQPLNGETHKHGKFTLAHNGNIPHKVQEKLIKHYKIKQISNSDSESIVRLIEKFAEEYSNFEDGLIKFVNTVEGVYNLLILTENKNMYAIRDRHGVRPLTLGKACNTEYHITSETCAFNEDIKPVRDIKAGEILRVHSPYTNQLEISTVYQFKSTSPTFCSFEYIYFMRPSSTFADIDVQSLRFQMGVHLAFQETTIPTDDSIVIGMPNTAIPVGEGFASIAMIPYHQYIKKTKDCGRTFILPDNADRLNRLRNKFFFDSNLKDKVIYLCDDSIVRGNTMRELIHLLKTEHKVKKVHVRISSPPVKDICHYGIDIPDKETLIGATIPTIKQIQESIKADTLVYLSLEDMKTLMETSKQKVCTSCFDGIYNNKLLDW